MESRTFAVCSSNFLLSGVDWYAGPKKEREDVEVCWFQTTKSCIRQVWWIGLGMVQHPWIPWVPHYQMLKTPSTIPVGLSTDPSKNLVASHRTLLPVFFIDLKDELRARKHTSKLGYFERNFADAYGCNYTSWQVSNI
eukprot:1137457-Pelagomonas_calceolata.AAC.1